MTALEDRLNASRHITPAGCWEWTRSRKPNGYGEIGIAGRARLVHRVAYTELVGPIPDGLDLDHLCRNRACFNPAHLEPVTRSENLRRGVGPAITRARHAAVTTCPQGHPYDDRNTGYKVDGARRCRACARAYARSRYVKRGN